MSGSSSSSEEETESESEAYEDAQEEGQSPLIQVEENVNKRAGHVTVEYQGEALVWAGYREVPPDLEEHEYWSTAEVWRYAPFTHKWRCLVTTGDIPTRCSGSGACVLEDRMYTVAGFHRILVTRRSAAAAAGEDEDDEDEEEEDEEDGEVVGQAVEISNRIWSLHLPSLVWTAHRPTGRPPFRCDKTACWSYIDRVYVFGGFGPPPDKQYQDILGKKVQFLGDSSTSDVEMYSRGWNNQLLYFHTGEERWVWPECSGSPPCPRAAHSAIRIEDAVYIFGGRSDDVRMNDLYRLDLRSHTWTNLMLPGNFPPVGRSWQSLIPLETGQPEGGLLLYGGFDNDKNVLSDCWRLDLASEPLAWQEMKHLQQGPRLWHTSAAVNQSVMIIGGLINNILAPAFVTKHHADKVLFLRLAPPSLFTLSLEYISEHRNLFRSEWGCLPFNLRKILEIRASGGA